MEPTVERVLTGFRVDPGEEPPSHDRTGPVVVPDTVDGLRDAIGADVFDVAVRRIGNMTVDIVIDDEGLLKDEILVSAIDPFNKAMLVGTILILGHGKDGELVSLTDDEVEMVMDRVRIARMVDGRIQWMLTCVT